MFDLEEINPDAKGYICHVAIALTDEQIAIITKQWEDFCRLCGVDTIPLSIVNHGMSLEQEHEGTGDNPGESK